ncbi:MAG: biopolymer transport protein ExbB, partial [Verrucomicrobiales bacterium]
MTQNSPLQPATARRRFAPIFIVLGVLLVTIFIMPDLFAQDGDADAPAKKTGLSYIKDAGLWMVPLGICSMATIALVVYNFMQLTTTKFAPVELRMALLDHMQNCRVRSAIEVSSTSPTYLGRMSSTSLPHVDATEPETLGREAVEDAMAEFTIRENAGHMTWISYLGLLGQIAPMLGLLGT